MRAIHYTDRLLPQLLDALHFDPANDLLIVSADHGEQFFEHGYWLHGRNMLPEEIQVPLLVRWDGFTRRTVATPVGLVDWFPTFAELYAATAPDGLIGRSLLPALIGEDLPERPVYSEAHVYYAAGAAVVANGHLYWLSADNSKLTPWVDWPYAEWLCDLTSDPHCEHDLSISDPGEAERLNGVLRELNPVWPSFSSDAIRVRPESVQLGRQLLRNVPDASVSLQPDMPPLQIFAALDEPGQLHVLSFDYRISSGEIDVSLQARSPDRFLWRRRLLHSATEWQTLRVKLRLGAAKLVLRIRSENGGKAKIRLPALRRLQVPELAIHVWPGAAEVKEATAPLSDREADRLRALGYLE
jgi:hypothetical protein